MKREVAFATERDARAFVATIEAVQGYPARGRDYRGNPVGPEAPGPGWTLHACRLVARASDVVLLISEEQEQALDADPRVPVFGSRDVDWVATDAGTRLSATAEVTRER